MDKKSVFKLASYSSEREKNMDINEIKNLPDRITTGILISKFQNALYQYRNNVIEKDSFLLILS